MSQGFYPLRRHMDPLKNQAIQQALIGNWQEAIQYNQQILDEVPEDIDTLNRLAFAFASIGNSKEAKSLYLKVLTLDTKNPIATRNLKRINSQNGHAPGSQPILVNNIFIEEPGKTKVIELINIADQKVISPLRSGEAVTLSVKRMKIFVLGNNNQYLGMLPDDVGRRLIKFLEGGNKYEAYVKTAGDHKAIIFIKETKRAKRFENQPSFTHNLSEKSKFVVNKTTHQTHTDDDDEDSEEEETESF
jgi:tetratricopeptide (TPR) repeat protein